MTSSIGHIQHPVGIAQIILVIDVIEARCTLSLHLQKLAYRNGFFPLFFTSNANAGQVGNRRLFAGFVARLFGLDEAAIRRRLKKENEKMSHRT